MSCNCKLKHTSWLNDLVPPTDSQINFKPQLQSLIDSFNPAFSGIWRPIIINDTRFKNRVWMHESVPTTGNWESIHQGYLGYDKFIKIDNPQFKSWTIGGNLDVCVDIGESYYLNSIPLNLTASSLPSIQNNFSAQTINVIRNRLNDEAQVTEPLLSTEGLIPRIDSASNIEKIEVIPRGKVFGLEATNDELKGMFSASLSSGGLRWTFSGILDKFKYLSASEYLNLDYTIFTKKNVPGQTEPITGQYSVRVSIFGQNDLVPPVVVSDVGSTTVDLSENNIPYAEGFITIRDEDLSQNIYVYVDDVTISGEISELKSSEEDIKKMLLFDNSVLRGPTTKQQTVKWIFNAGTDNFTYLSKGQSLILTYKLYIYDNLGNYTIYNKTISIVGKNDAPGIGFYDIFDSSGGIYNLNQPQDLFGKLSYYDPDISDSVTPNVLSVSFRYSIPNLVLGYHDVFRNMLSVSGGGAHEGKINWTFQPDNEFLKYLGGGQIVEANYIIQIIDNNGARGYGLVSIIVIGKNEDITINETEISRVYTLEPPPTATKSIIDDGYITALDDNTSDLFNINIIGYQYELTNVRQRDLPKNFDISHMLYFVPEPGEAKNSFNKQGIYRWIFNSYPQHFRFLDRSDKVIKINYQVIFVDTYGSYQRVDFSFEIKGHAEPQPDNSTKIYKEYIFGWYRYYDLGRQDDNRFIPGVDFYFGYADTRNGSPGIVIPEYKNLNINVNNFTNVTAFQNSEKLPLVAPLRFNSNQTRYLQQYFPNVNERNRIIGILNTSPYIDLLTHDVIEIDALDYTRDEYGRIIPLLSGISSKPFKDFSMDRFASTKQEIFYRLAQKYGLSLIVEESQTVSFKSKFLSDVGANVKIKHEYTVEKDPEQKDKLAFTDISLKVDDLTYSLSLCKLEGSKSPIVLDAERMKNSPVVIQTSGLPGVDDPAKAFFHIIDQRLNTNLIRSRYFLNDETNVNNLGSSQFEGRSSETILFHGHGGIRNNYKKITTFPLGPGGFTKGIFIIDHKISNAENIEGNISPIELIYYSNPGSRCYIHDIDIDYLRTSKRPECQPFVSGLDLFDTDGKYIMGTDTGIDVPYDFVKQEKCFCLFSPPISTYYLPPGNYYNNLNIQEKNLLNVNIHDHPEPGTPLIKTHNLTLLNPTESAQLASSFAKSSSMRRTSGAEEIAELASVGNFDFNIDIGGFKSGYLCLSAATSSGIFTLGIDNEDPIVSSSEYKNGIFNMCVKNTAKFHKEAKISIDVPDQCDHWEVKLSHKPYDLINRLMVSKIEINGSLGFFHPNSGWISDSKYHFKTPMIPYVTSADLTNQSGLQNNKKIKYDHYFWYDNEKMYNSDYLDGFNYMFNLSGLSDIISNQVYKSRFIGIKKNDYYLITPDFYKFKYIEEESPIKQSIKMSYIDIDYSNGYPFNNFRFYPLDTNLNLNKIIVSSSFGKKRPFSYFDDAHLENESIQLTNHETINIDNKLTNILLSINSTQTLLSFITEQIEYWEQQLTITDPRNIDEQNKLNNIIKNLFSQISIIQKNIELLTQTYNELINKKNNFFTANIIASSGNNEFLTLTIDKNLPNNLLYGGFIRKNPDDEHKSQSMLIYRPNIVRNDFNIKVNKWGNIVSGKNIDEYNSSLSKQQYWKQSSLFLNQNSRGIIESSGYYFPYVYGKNKYVSEGYKEYIVRDRDNSTLYDTNLFNRIILDSGNIHRSLDKVPTNLYLGPYIGDILISPNVRTLYGRIVFESTFGGNGCVFVSDNISNFGIKAGSPVKFSQNSYAPLPNYSGCIDFSRTYYVIPTPNISSRFTIGTSPSPTSILRDSCCSSGQGYLFAIIDDPKFDYDNPCIGNLKITYNNRETNNKFEKGVAVPIFAQIDNIQANPTDKFYKYLPSIMARYRASSPTINQIPLTRFVSQETTGPYLNDRSIGNIPGYFYSYVDDPLTKESDGYIQTNRYSLYNHNEDIKINYYTNVNGTDVSPVIVPSSLPVSGSLQGLLQRYPNSFNDNIDSVIRSLLIQIETLQENILVMNSYISDTSIRNEEKISYLTNISFINSQINMLRNTIDEMTERKIAAVPQDLNQYKKLPLTYNLNIPSGIYNASNSFLDMNIFTRDDRFKPTLLNNRKPAQSGYVYFEGLVESPLSDFYKNMQLPYDAQKMWIDIPDNADYSILTKYDKLFACKTQYSIVLEVKTDCDTNATKCESDDNICGTIDIVDKKETFFKTIGIDNYEEVFDVLEIDLPNDCSKIDLCCDTTLEIDMYPDSRFYKGSVYPTIPTSTKMTSPLLSKTNCETSLDTMKNSCKDIFKSSYGIVCMDRSCFADNTSASASFLYSRVRGPGALQGYNFTKNNIYQRGDPLFPTTSFGNYSWNPLAIMQLSSISGSVQHLSQKMLIFQPKKIKLKNYLNNNDPLTFINSTIDNELQYNSIFDNTYKPYPDVSPNRLAGGSLYVKPDCDDTVFVYPTGSVGLISVVSDIQSSGWTNKYSGASLIPYFTGINSSYFNNRTFNFLDINEENSEFISFKPNNQNLIWSNEIIYRDFIGYNKIAEPLYDYDIKCYGENNPYLDNRLNFSFRSNWIPGMGKEPFIGVGPLYDITIIDNDYTYIIKVSLVSCDGRMCVEYDMNLVDQNTVVRLDLSQYIFYEDSYYTDQGCSINELLPRVPNPPKSPEYKDVKKLYSIEELVQIDCGVRCPEDWFYCDDGWTERITICGEVNFESEEPPYPINITSNETAKILKQTGSSKRLCEELSGDEFLWGRDFRRAPHPDNYFVAKRNYDVYMAYPEVWVDETSSIIDPCRRYISSNDKVRVPAAFQFETGGCGSSTIEDKQGILVSFIQAFVSIRIYNNMIVINLNPEYSPSYTVSQLPSPPPVFYLDRHNPSSIVPIIKIKILNNNIFVQT